MSKGREFQWKRDITNMCRIQNRGINLVNFTRLKDSTHQITRLAQDAVSEWLYAMQTPAFGGR